MNTNPEKDRIIASKDNRTWRKWGPYVSERQWGTVREDYSSNGDAWHFVSHDKARSNTFRWGEEAIAGFCDVSQILCLAPAFWNGKDSILKERLYGLTNSQGNHGEDVKEMYFHLDSTPTHSYCKYLYKYPQSSFPYEDLVKGNQIGIDQPEFEILDTDAFEEGKYFDCEIEYAKADTEDILLKITVHNRGPEAHEIHVLPHVWFRNFWKHNPRFEAPQIVHVEEGLVRTKSLRNGVYNFYHDGGKALFCDNETNNMRIYGVSNDADYVKDGINDHVVKGKATVNPNKIGTKAAIWFQDTLANGASVSYRVRFSKAKKNDPWADFDTIFAQRKAEADHFYEELSPKSCSPTQKQLLRNAFGGLFWTKQFYYLDIHKWLHGGPGEKPPHRDMMRNFQWEHLINRDVISMPDKWEYPWYAAWDLAFHATSFAKADPKFAKDQLLLMLSESYLHPNGQIPAYEWSFSDVNPPVHSWAVWEVYAQDKQDRGEADRAFLEECFQKLLLTYTWWVNQKDRDGNALYAGGFLGLDNIGVFDRNHMPKGITKMEQADATSWMALFTLNMLRMSVELAQENKVYEEFAIKFLRHFLNIGWAMHHMGGSDISLWDDEDAFYYDVVQMESGFSSKMKVRSLVGIIPLFAVEVIHGDLIDRLRSFMSQAHTIITARPDLASLVSRIEEKNEEGAYLFSIMRRYRLEKVLEKLLDEDEFLSDYGIRSLSKYHQENPFIFNHHGKHKIEYVPGESNTDMFGGNSNWRGPIWFPLNYLIIRSLLRFYSFYGPDHTYEFPTGSGTRLNLKEIASALTHRLLRIFERNQDGQYQYHNPNPNDVFAKDPHFKDLHLFYEFFHGETGRGLGASHQTGWTALIANLLLELDEMEK